MPKTIPDCPASLPKVASTLVRQEYRIELITPLFGGGVEAGENDPTMPIRGTSIRGQLQFWWRATRGAACSGDEELRARHREIWGATECASPVVVELADLQASDPVPCGAIAWNPKAGKGQGAWRLTWRDPFRQNEDLPYVLFPFQGVLPRNDPAGTVEEHPANCIHRAAFTLRLRFPSAMGREVDAAVWAWVNFGGLGARTRRGCGALRCRDLAPPSAKMLAEWYRKGAGAHLAPHRAAPLDWPVLPSRLLARPHGGEPLGVWNWLAGLLRHFRQGVGFARNPGQGPRPGRSRYPEPETIREMVGANRGLSGHQRLEQVPADAFPRAEFGLPIVFHFQGRGEPPDTTLQPVIDGKAQERMASPLILKPLALADGQAVPILVPLCVPGVSEIELMLGSRSRGRLGADAIRHPRLAAYPSSPLGGLTHQGSALEAFLNFARVPQAEDGPGFEEIAP
jgi:CRISPR-associated protein Cmr1